MVLYILSYFNPTMTKELFIVGTSHIAKQSIVTVKKIVEENLPEVVGVELDMSRYRGLVQEQQNKARPGLSYIRKIGVKGFIFALIGSLGMKKLAKYVGTTPGVDMLESINIAKKNNAKVALIDQNINITLSKFSKNLSKREIGRFFWDILRGIFNPKGELKRMGLERFDLSTIPTEEIVEKMIQHMKKRYPNVYDVLVYKRNIYMAKKIMMIMQRDDINKMVVVVGAGHRKGLKEILEVQSSAHFSIKLV